MAVNIWTGPVDASGLGLMIRRLYGMLIVQPLLHNHYITVNTSLYAGSIRGTFN